MGISVAFDRGLRLCPLCHAFTGLIDGRKCGAVREVFFRVIVARCGRHFFLSFFVNTAERSGVHRPAG